MSLRTWKSRHPKGNDQVIDRKIREMVGIMSPKLKRNLEVIKKVE